MKKNWLRNKNVIITGASGGLGFAITTLLINKYNCNVLGIARNKQKIENAKQSLGDKKDKFTYLLLDVSKKESWDEIKNHVIDTNFMPDLLINNAGFMLPFSRFEKVTENEIEEIVNTNFMATVFGVKKLLPVVKASSTPAIVNIASAAGMCAIVGQSMYCATKSAVRGFTETLQQDYKKQIYIAGVYPGFLKTNILDKMTISAKESKLINKLMMPVEKAAKKIVRRIAKRRKRIVIGLDGRAMTYFSRLFPKFTPTAIRKVLKITKLAMFDDVFN